MTDAEARAARRAETRELMTRPVLRLYIYAEELPAPTTPTEPTPAPKPRRRARKR